MVINIPVLDPNVLLIDRTGMILLANSVLGDDA
jgi:hypothetical protein